MCHCCQDNREWCPSLCFPVCLAEDASESLLRVFQLSYAIDEKTTARSFLNHLDLGHRGESHGYPDYGINSEFFRQTWR